MIGLPRESGADGAPGRPAFPAGADAPEPDAADGGGAVLVGREVQPDRLDVDGVKHTVKVAIMTNPHSMARMHWCVVDCRCGWQSPLYGVMALAVQAFERHVAESRGEQDAARG